MLIKQLPINTKGINASVKIANPINFLWYVKDKIITNNRIKKNAVDKPKILSALAMLIKTMIIIHVPKVMK
jgi:hypothetical protein